MPILFGIVLVLSALAAPLAAQEAGGGIVSGAGGSYQLRPGDILQIRVWGQETFSGQFQVDETWSIYYPVLGQINVESLTVNQVRERLREGLERIFTTPFVTVTPLFRMAVLGEVRSSGLYTVDPTLSVLDVVALAGGASPDGNLRKIRLIRGGQELRVDFEREAIAGRTLADIGVRSGDEIVVPRKWFTRSDFLLVAALLQVGLSIAIFANTVN
jgi:polysaccharide export outer membrane protein